MTKMTKEQASKRIAELVSQAHEAINEAERIADKSGVGFSFSVDYGMGGYYDPEDICEYTDSGWFPSSVGC